MSHAIVDIQKINRDAASVESVVHTADMDNGVVVMLGAQVAGEGELKQVVIPATATIANTEVLLVASSEVQGPMYEPYSTLQDFYNLANKPARAYRLRVGDEFLITVDGFDGTAAVNSYLIPQNNSLKLVVAADLAGGTRFAAKIIQIGQKFGYTGVGFAKKDAILVKVSKV